MKGITLQSENSINIIPNPAEDFAAVYINALETGTATLTIYDMTGKVVWQQAQSLSSGHVTPVIITGLNALAVGVYLVHLAADIYSESRLLMVK